MPYPHLTDEQVIQNAKNLYYGNQLQVKNADKYYLKKPFKYFLYVNNITIIEEFLLQIKLK